MSLRSYLLVSLAVLSASIIPAGRGWAQPVGEVLWDSPSARLSHQGECSSTYVPRPICVGDAIDSPKTGKARLVFTGRVVVDVDRLRQQVDYVNLDVDSSATVEKYDHEPSGPDARFVLDRGNAYFSTTGPCEVQTPTCIAIAKGTAFAVSFDAATRRTEVITLSGSVWVRGIGQSEQDAVAVTAREMTSVNEGGVPLAAYPASEDQIKTAIEGLQFHGAGRPESLTARDPLATGEDVALSEQLDAVPRPPPGFSDPCLQASAPTCVLSEPIGGVGILEILF